MRQRSTNPDREPLLVVGAHAFDAEVMAGGVAAARARQGSRVVLLHLTLGEGGHSSKSLDEYKAQKRNEAEAAAKILGAEAAFAGQPDGDLGRGKEVALAIVEWIRSLRPSAVVTHWRGSWHPDHVAAHEATMRALLLAGLPSVASDGMPSSHVPTAVLFGENWEDSDGFRPELYEDISEDFEVWQAALGAYEIGSDSPEGFPYRDYYAALARMRGCISGVRYAEAFYPAPAATMRGLALPSPVWSAARLTPLSPP
jgi:N-acetylglucosamine malate deacetylase 1